MKKTALIACVFLLAPLLASAQTSIESLAAGAASFNLPAFSRLTGIRLATPKNDLHRPFDGTVVGTFNGAPVNLVFNRNDWGISGRVGASAVNIGIDNQAGAITGTEGSSVVDLFLDWDPNDIRISGTDAGLPYNVELNVTGGSLVGEAEGSPIRASFRMDGGAITGTNTGLIALSYDVVSGRVNGVINGSPLDVTLTNLDISDFMEHLYLFLAPQS